MTNIENFLAEQARAREKFAKSQELIQKYKNQMPDLTHSWDISPNSISFNDVCRCIRLSGLNIYCCPMDELWAGLFKPSVYEAETLWENDHDPGKIAGVIDAWANGVSLSPIFLVKHPDYEQGLVADGKHRLTVSRATSAKVIPFMVETNKAAWVFHAFPLATCIHQNVQCIPTII